MHVWRGALVLGLAAAASCGRAAGPATTAAMRDSAGIRIVENQAPVHPDAPWVLDTPIMDLGNHRGDPNQEFSAFVYPIRLSDGRVVVANGGTNELRFFGADGKWLKRSGGRAAALASSSSSAGLDWGAGDTLRDL